MKIPKDLSPFPHRNALLIVAGKQDAIFYSLKGQHLKKISSFKTPKPFFSDKEGVVKDIRDSNIIQHFLSEMKEQIKKISFATGEIIIFAPSQTKNKIKEILPSGWKNKIKTVIDGNYFNMHPLQILKKLQFVYLPEYKQA